MSGYSCWSNPCTATASACSGVSHAGASRGPSDHSSLVGKFSNQGAEAIISLRWDSPKASLRVRHRVERTEELDERLKARNRDPTILANLVEQAVRDVEQELGKLNLYNPTHTCQSSRSQLLEKYKEAVKKKMEGSNVEVSTEIRPDAISGIDCECPEHIIDGSKLKKTNLTLVTFMDMNQKRDKSCYSAYYTRTPCDQYTVGPIKVPERKVAYMRHLNMFNRDVQMVVNDWPQSTGGPTITSDALMKELAKRNSTYGDHAHVLRISEEHDIVDKSPPRPPFAFAYKWGIYRRVSWTDHDPTVNEPTCANNPDGTAFFRSTPAAMEEGMAGLPEQSLDPLDHLTGTSPDTFVPCPTHTHNGETYNCHEPVVVVRLSGPMGLRSEAQLFQRTSRSPRYSPCPFQGVATRNEKLQQDLQDYNSAVQTVLFKCANDPDLSKCTPDSAVMTCRRDPSRPKKTFINTLYDAIDDLDCLWRLEMIAPPTQAGQHDRGWSKLVLGGHVFHPLDTLSATGKTIQPSTTTSEAARDMVVDTWCEEARIGNTPGSDSDAVGISPGTGWGTENGAWEKDQKSRNIVWQQEVSECPGIKSLRDIKGDSYTVMHRTTYKRWRTSFTISGVTIPEGRTDEGL